MQLQTNSIISRVANFGNDVVVNNVRRPAHQLEHEERILDWQSSSDSEDEQEAEQEETMQEEIPIAHNVNHETTPSIGANQDPPTY